MMIDNEKPLVLTERELKQLVEVIVDNKFLEYIDYFRAEQEKEIQMAQDQILFVAQQNQEYREQQVKQAKIDVLNELKTQLKAKEQHYIWMYDWDGYTAVVDCANEVDELIKEVENDKCNC